MTATTRTLIPCTACPKYSPIDRAYMESDILLNVYDKVSTSQHFGGEEAMYV